MQHLRPLRPIAAVRGASILRPLPVFPPRRRSGIGLAALAIQSAIKSAITAKFRPQPINPRSGLYLLLTADDVSALLCLGSTISRFRRWFAWVGNSAKLCPGQCAYPFAMPAYIPNQKPFKSPNGDVGVDGMISVIGYGMAELASNPLASAWYAGQDPSFPVEIADLCEGIYGTVCFTLCCR
ncbi:hypothetical protein VIGAN_01006000 [Vigna angularis var. angularis]|uniref:Uncharacterized protein n=1 Tax=Vigna angularis var. angularis TaxID=157739 RepID=A0A0S3QWB3_PHAAN|nr:hypothetical protein VIGAN_01006000 [Vigna angularis var. angularis]